MMSKQNKITIEMANGDKKEFTQNKWSPMKCFGNLHKIGKAFAVPLSMLASGNEDNFGEVLPQALFMLFEQMEESDIWSLFELIVDDVHVDATRRVNLNEDLEDDLGAILQLVAEALKGNYGSLFMGKGLTALMTQLGGMSQVAQQK